MVKSCDDDLKSSGIFREMNSLVSATKTKVSSGYKVQIEH